MTYDMECYRHKVALEGDMQQRTCETRARHDSDRAFSSSVMSILLPSCNRCNCASSSNFSQGSHCEGNLTRGGSGGMNPVRVSTSQSCAASVVVSTTPAGERTRTSGRGRARKWLGGRNAIETKAGGDEKRLGNEAVYI